MSIQEIKQHEIEIFGSDNLLTDPQRELLSWSLPPAGNSPQGAIVIDQNIRFFEVRRALSRVFCLSLLKRGPKNYHVFVATQTEDDKYNPPLKEEQYQFLCNLFKNLTPIEYDTLVASTLISGVTLKPETRSRADALGVKYIMDSVEFISATFDDIEVAQKIYEPVLKPLYDKYPGVEAHTEITQALQSAFAHNRHFRHMFFTEGNANMFKPLIKDVTSGKLTKLAFDFWVLHWITNMVGFEGHIAPKGARYYHSNIATGVEALLSSLQLIFTKQATAPEVLLDYLDKRAQILKLTSAEKAQPNYSTLMIAHLGALMNLFMPEDGIALEKAAKGAKISPELISSYFNVADDSEPTPTFAPAFFINAIKFHESKGLDRLKALGNTVTICLPLYLSALVEYQKKRAAGELNAQLPLSFKACADRQNIMDICGLGVEAFDILQLRAPQIDKNAEVKFELLNKPELAVANLEQKEGEILTAYGLSKSSGAQSSASSHSLENPRPK